MQAKDGRGNELGSGDSTKGCVAKNSETSRSHSNTTWSGIRGPTHESVFAGLHSSPRLRILTLPYSRLTHDEFLGGYFNRSTERLRSLSRWLACTAAGLLFRRRLAVRIEAWRPKRAWGQGGVGTIPVIAERDRTRVKWELRIGTSESKLSVTEIRNEWV